MRVYVESKLKRLDSMDTTNAEKVGGRGGMWH